MLGEIIDAGSIAGDKVIGLAKGGAAALETRRTISTGSNTAGSGPKIAEATVPTLVNSESSHGILFYIFHSTRRHTSTVNETQVTMNLSDIRRTY